MKCVVILSFLSIFTLLGCSSDFDELAGNWVAESLSSGNLDCEEQLDGSYILDIEARSETFGISLDINTCSGSIKGARRGNIEFKDPACTEACCDSEGALCLLDALLKVDSYNLQGDELILSGNSVEIVFKAQ
jgi:heat shock protein HslJ